MASSLPPSCVEGMNKAWTSFQKTENPDERVHPALIFVINLKGALTFRTDEGRIWAERIRAEPLTHEFYHVCMEHLKEHMGVAQWDAFTNFHGYDKVLDH